MQANLCLETVDLLHELPKENLDQCLLHLEGLFLHWRAFLGENTSMHNHCSIALEITSRFKVVGIQPICTALQQLLPNFISRKDRPSRRVPESCFYPQIVSSAD